MLTVTSPAPTPIGVGCQLSVAIAPPGAFDDYVAATLLQALNPTFAVTGAKGVDAGGATCTLFLGLDQNGVILAPNGAGAVLGSAVTLTVARYNSSNVLQESAGPFAGWTHDPLSDASFLLRFLPQPDLSAVTASIAALTALLSRTFPPP